MAPFRHNLDFGLTIKFGLTIWALKIAIVGKPNTAWSFEINQKHIHITIRMMKKLVTDVCQFLLDWI